MININLLPRKGAQEILTTRWLLGLKRGSFYLLAIYGLVFLGVFGARMVVNNLNARLVQKQEKVVEAINSLSKLESTHILVKTKLDAAERILPVRKNWYQLLLKVRDLFISDNQIKELGLTESGELRITVETTDLKEFARMLDAVNQFGALLSGAEKKEGGVYTFTVDFKT